MRTVPDLEPWEVMKAASEGKRIAFKWREGPGNIPAIQECSYPPAFDWHRCEYFVIVPPNNHWDEFDYEFFNQYGGLPVTYISGGPTEGITDGRNLHWLDDNATLRPSPFYFWGGGACPVPENAEVDVWYRGKDTEITLAGNLQWSHSPFDSPMDSSLKSALGDIIAFRLTGNVASYKQGDASGSAI